MSESWRKWYMQDILMMTVAPVAVFFMIRTILGAREAQKENFDIASRLKGILAARERDIEDGSDSEEDAYYSDDETGEKVKIPRVAKTPRSERELNLTSYEQTIAADVVQPSSIPISFADIGGLDEIISELQETVIYPLTLPSIYRRSSPLLAAPSGVLLYGPPGCGKTMLAKALAHESNAVFINLHISTLTEKWYGDSNKLVAAVFSLARKLAPAIVFIDEIDAILGTRRTAEHEASGMVKAEMMTHWDGLASADARGRPQQVLVLGATNRPQDIDDAFLRRMPKRFAVGLPAAEQRRRIFDLVLRDTATDDPPRFDLDFLVAASAGMSGSDIKEACRDAAMAPVRELIRQRREAGVQLRGAHGADLRGLRTEDFFQSASSANRFAFAPPAAGGRSDEIEHSDGEGGGVEYETVDEDADEDDGADRNATIKAAGNGAARNRPARRRKARTKSGAET